jgi:hypothetical protein
MAENRRFMNSFILTTSKGAMKFFTTNWRWADAFAYVPKSGRARCVRATQNIKPHNLSSMDDTASFDTPWVPGGVSIMEIKELRFALFIL